MYRQANLSMVSSGVTARGTTFNTGRIDSRARFRPTVDSRKVCEWLRRQAIASITTTTVMVVISSGASAIKC
ncbi:hypothetical protein D3C81_2220630 [compost metagenome]